MNAIALIRSEIKTAHQWFNETIDDVTDDLAHWQPGGNTHPIGSRYAHIVVSEDVMVNVLIKNSASLYATTWANRTGLEDPQAAFNTTLDWANSVRVDMNSMHQYAQAVYKNTDQFLETLREDELERRIDLTDSNLGTWSLGSFLISFVLGHVRDLMGEISAIKGLQGMQGYPF